MGLRCRVRAAVGKIRQQALFTDGSGDTVGYQQGQAVVADSPGAINLSQNAGASTTPQSSVGQNLVKPGNLALVRDIDVALQWQVGPALAARKTVAGIIFEGRYSPAFAGISAHEDTLRRESTEVAIKVCMGCRQMKVIQEAVDGRFLVRGGCGCLNL